MWDLSSHIRQYIRTVFVSRNTKSNLTLKTIRVITFRNKPLLLFVSKCKTFKFVSLKKAGTHTEEKIKVLCYD